MEDQLYLPVLEEVRYIFSTYFEEVSWEDEQEVSWEDEQKKTQDRTKETYHSACVDYYGSLPPEIMNDPKPLSEKNTTIRKSWWVDDQRNYHSYPKFYFNIKVNRFYFTYSDWEHIVIKQEKDSLLRVESSEDLWVKWKHQFATFDETKSNIYSIFNNEVTKGKVYLIKQGEEDLYKIGYTKGDENKRVSQLQTGNPQKLEIVGSFQCTGQKTEKTLHSLFSKQCKMLEWYSLSQQDLKNILDPSWRVSNNIF